MKIVPLKEEGPKVVGSVEEIKRSQLQSSPSPDKEQKPNDNPDEVKEIVLLPTKKDGNSAEFIKAILPISVDKFFELFVCDDAVFSSKDRLQLQGIILKLPFYSKKKKKKIFCFSVSFFFLKKKC